MARCALFEALDRDLRPGPSEDAERRGVTTCSQCRRRQDGPAIPSPRELPGAFQHRKRALDPRRADAEHAREPGNNISAVGMAGELERAQHRL